MATVKKVAATADAARAEWNAKQTLRTQNAKSGGTVRLYSAIASAGKNAEKGMGKKTKIVKINSNPVPGNTRIGKLSGGGLGGMFGIKNR